MSGGDDGLSDLQERLMAARPRPDPSFLNRLARLIESPAPGDGGQPWVGAQIAAFAAAGLALLALAAAVTFL
jgi:hypothetical protein